MIKAIEKIKDAANESGMTVCCYICLPAAIIIGLVALIASVVALALADFETAMNVSTIAMEIAFPIALVGFIVEVWDRLH